MTVPLWVWWACLGVVGLIGVACFATVEGGW